jgi:soluble lytic murein transglycosylase
LNFKKHYKHIIFFIIITLTIVLIIDTSTTFLKRIYPLKYNEHVFKYSKENNIDPHLVFAVIKAESSFDPKALSKKNAIGLMQLTEKTARWGALSIGIKDFSINLLYEPEINIALGCWYIRQLMEEFNNNVDLVITAYNGGSGNVKEWLGNVEYSKTGHTLDKIPFKETERFLKRVKNYHFVYAKLYSL